MDQLDQYSPRLTTLVRENRATLQRLQAELNSLKLLLELQGLKVDAPKRKLDSEGAGSSQPISIASW